MWLDKEMVPNAAPKVIVSEFNGITNAFLVSGVTRIHRLSWEQVEPPSGYVASFSGNSFTGVVKFEDRIVLLLERKNHLDLTPAWPCTKPRTCALAWKPRRSSSTGPGVVDDSTSIRKLIVNTLVRDGYEVAQTSTARKPGTGF